MPVITNEITINTKREGDIVDITNEVQRSVQNSGLTNGIATVFIPGATGAITTIEYEPGLLKDLPDALDRLFPKNITYHHELRWHDGNGHSHVRASFLKPDLTAPFSNKKLILGTWQQIVFLELDNGGRRRHIVVQMIGE
jgi:secondary thiamine-phosphate synthase enzyme